MNGIRRSFFRLHYSYLFLDPNNGPSLMGDLPPMAVQFSADAVITGWIASTHTVSAVT